MDTSVVETLKSNREVGTEVGLEAGEGMKSHRYLNVLCKGLAFTPGEMGNRGRF